MELPSHNIKVGDEVTISSQRKDAESKTKIAVEAPEIFGIVKAIHSTYVEVICDDVEESELREPVRMDLRVSEQTHKKMTAVLNEMESAEHTSQLLQLLFSYIDAPASVVDPLCRLSGEGALQKPLMFGNQALNESQCVAIRECLQPEALHLIHGPVRFPRPHASLSVFVVVARHRQDVYGC